jgi:hypothetical protein
MGAVESRCVSTPGEHLSQGRYRDNKVGTMTRKNNPKQNIEYFDHARFNDFNLFADLPGFRQVFSLAVQQVVWLRKNLWL